MNNKFDLSEISTTLTGLGINIKDEDGKYKSFKLVLDDLARVYGDINEDAKKELINVLVGEGCVDKGSDLLNEKELRIKSFSIRKSEDGSYSIMIQQQDENDWLIGSEFSKITELKDYSFNVNNGELTLKFNITPINEEYGRILIVPKHTYEA